MVYHLSGGLILKTHTVFQMDHSFQNLNKFIQASLIAQLVKRIHLQCRRPRFDSWVGKIRWRKDRPPTPVFLGFPCGSADKESAHNVGDLGLIPGLGRSPGEGKGYRLWYSGLENSMDCMGSQRVGHDWGTFTSLHFTNELPHMNIPVLYQSDKTQ